MSIHTIITADQSGEELVKFSEQVADRLVKDNLTRSQIRTVFTEVRQIEGNWGSPNKEAVHRLSMLKPKLFYQSARTPTVSYLSQVLNEAIDEVIKAPADKQDLYFKRFVDLFEAILAYHRAKGGRN
jgi:CRISPR-associated protein Csm2